MNVETLKDYRLTLEEWNLLPGIAAHHMTYERNPAHVDMLVLAGLVIRLNEGLALTTEGVEAATAIDMIFDWDDFAVAGSPVKVNAMEEALARPERLTVGSLVRHIRTGGVGLITEHTMWDADHGAFRVNFVKPVAMSDLTSQLIDSITDRHDTFERI